MSLQFVAVGESLAALDVEGLTIYTPATLPSAASQREASLMPLLPDYIQNFSMERNSFGGGSTAKMTVTYSLHYVLTYASVGTGRTLASIFGEMVKLLGLLYDAILAIDVFSGSVDITPNSPTNMGVVTDPAGNQFLGCFLSVTITEFVN